jgi:hypothetical protein
MGAIDVYVVPEYQTLDETVPGATASVDLIADIPEPDAIVGWGMDLNFDDVLLDLFGGGWDTAVTIGPLFDAAYAPDGDYLAGLVPMDCLWGEDILLATVTFVDDPLGGLGVSQITPCDSNPPDLTEGFALCPPPEGEFAEVNYYCGAIEVIPEPASLSLLALCGLLALRRR